MALFEKKQAYGERRRDFFGTADRVAGTAAAGYGGYKLWQNMKNKKMITQGITRAGQNLVAPSAQVLSRGGQSLLNSGVVPISRRLMAPVTQGVGGTLPKALGGAFKVTKPGLWSKLLSGTRSAASTAARTGSDIKGVAQKGISGFAKLLTKMLKL